MIMNNKQALNFVNKTPKFKVQFSKEGREFYYDRYSDNYFRVFTRDKFRYVEAYMETVATFTWYVANTMYVSNWLLTQAPQDFLGMELDT